jgi:hypothetical protein
MTNSLTTVPASVPTTNSTASPSSTVSVPRRFALAAAAVVGLATVSIFTVSAVGGTSTGTDRSAEVATASITVDGPWALQPEEAAFVAGGVSAAAAVTVDTGWTLEPEEAAFITQTASPAPAVTAPECVVGAPC